MGLWPGPEGYPPDSSALQSSVVRDRLDGLYWGDLKPGRVEAEAVPSMRVYIHPTYGKGARTDAAYPLLFWGGYSNYLTAPSSNPRMDLICLIPTAVSGNVGAIFNVTGDEAASPVLPLTPDGMIPIAILYMRPGMTSIKNVDDSSNGYISYRVQPQIASPAPVTVKRKNVENQPVVNTDVETVISAVSFTIPAYSLGGYDGVDNNWFDFYINVAEFDLVDTCILKAKFDGTVIAQLVIVAGSAITDAPMVIWIRLRSNGANNSQKCSMTLFSTAEVISGAGTSVGIGGAAINSALPKDFTFTVQFSNSDPSNKIVFDGVQVSRSS